MIKGIIFDMDGVISDTQKLHSQVETELLGRYGINISPEEVTKKYAGVRTRDFFDELLKSQSTPYNLDELMNEKRTKMTTLASASVEAIPGSQELIQKLSDKGLALAVASASNFDYVTQVLTSLGVIEKFLAIVSGDMVTNGKPDPEIFLLAASKINISPENCLVIEDGISGMMAARAGGMKCIALVSNPNETYPTNNIVTSLSQVTLDYIESIGQQPGL